MRENHMSLWRRNVKIEFPVDDDERQNRKKEKSLKLYAFGNVVAANNSIRLQTSSVAEHHRKHAERLFDARLQVRQLLEGRWCHSWVLVAKGSLQLSKKFVLFVPILT